MSKPEVGDMVEVLQPSAYKERQHAKLFIVLQVWHKKCYPNYDNTDSYTLLGAYKTSAGNIKRTMITRDEKVIKYYQKAPLEWRQYLEMDAITLYNTLEQNNTQAKFNSVW